jgi:hypothetical protein
VAKISDGAHGVLINHESKGRYGSPEVQLCEPMSVTYRLPRSGPRRSRFRSGLGGTRANDPRTGQTVRYRVTRSPASPATPEMPIKRGFLKHRSTARSTDVNAPFPGIAGNNSPKTQTRIATLAPPPRDPPAHPPSGKGFSCPTTSPRAAAYGQGRSPHRRARPGAGVRRSSFVFGNCI